MTPPTLTPARHQALRDQLLDLAIGVLPAREAREVEAHADGCAACRAELASLRGVRAAAAALPPIEAPARGEAILLAAARQEAEAAATRRRPGLPRWLWGAALSGAGVAAAVVAIQLGSQVGGPSRFDDGREDLAARGAPAEAPAMAPPSPRPSAIDAVTAEPARQAAPEQGAVATGGVGGGVREGSGERRSKGDEPTMGPAGPPPSAPHRKVVALAERDEFRAAPAAKARPAGALPASPAAVAAAPAAPRAEAPAPAGVGTASDLAQTAGPGGGTIGFAAPARSEAAPERVRAKEARQPADASARAATAAEAKAEAGPPAAEAEAPARALRREAAPAAVASATAPGAPLRSEIRTLDGCGERRVLHRDAEGRLVGRERTRQQAGLPTTVVETYGPDGRLAGARLQVGARSTAYDRAALERTGFVLDGALRAAPTAAEAEAGGCDPWPR